MRRAMTRRRVRRAAGRRPGGFTLIELLVVLAIVALLASIALPRYFGSLRVARETALRENLRVMRSGIDRFHADKGRYPRDLDELVAQRYLREVPVDPVAETRDGWVGVTAESDDGGGIRDVHSGAAGTAADGQAFSAL